MKKEFDLNELEKEIDRLNEKKEEIIKCYRISREIRELKEQKKKIEKLIEVKEYLKQPNVISDDNVISGYDLKHLIDDEKEEYECLRSAFDMKKFPYRIKKKYLKSERNVFISYSDNKLLLNYVFADQQAALFNRGEIDGTFYFYKEIPEPSYSREIFNKFVRKNVEAMQNLYIFAQRNIELFSVSECKKICINDGPFEFLFRDIDCIDGNTYLNFECDDSYVKCEEWQSNFIDNIIKEEEDLILKKISIKLEELPETVRKIYFYKKNNMGFENRLSLINRMSEYI